MPKLPRWTALEAECVAGGSYRIYGNAGRRVTVPFHTGTTLHPKIVKQVLDAIDGAGQSTMPEHSDY